MKKVDVLRSLRGLSTILSKLNQGRCCEHYTRRTAQIDHDLYQIDEIYHDLDKLEPKLPL